MPSSRQLARVATLSSAVLAAVFVACACAGRGESDDTASVGVSPDATPAVASSAAALGDAEIAHVAVTANSIDSAAGSAAQSKARDGQVKDFAQQMVRDHGAVNKQALALAQRLNVTPAENDVSRQLQQGAEQARTDLSGKSGAEFDRAYIDREVQYHLAVLDALDQMLIPGAQNAELKTLLQQVRPNIAAHLERARSIQSKLGRQ